MNAWDRVSVLTVTYKGDHLTADCLRTMQVACGGTLPETVIVDNSPQASTRELVKSYKNTSYIAAPSNLGFAGGNNLGWPKTTKEFVLLLNNDTVMDKEPFTELVAFMDAHPKASIIQGTVLFHNDNPDTNGKMDGAGTYLTKVGLCKVRGWIGSPESPEAKTAAPAFYVNGAFFFIRRSHLARVGNVLFYDHFSTYYEEADLCHRTWLTGGEVWYTPTNPIGHVHSATFSKLFTRESVMRQFYRNMWFSFLTCFGPRGLFTIVPIFFTLCCGQIFVSLCRGNLMPLKCHLWAAKHVWQSHHDIRIARHQVQAERKLTDTQLFARVTIPLTWRGFWGAVRGNI